MARNLGEVLIEKLLQAPESDSGVGRVSDSVA